MLAADIATHCNSVIDNHHYSRTYLCHHGVARLLNRLCPVCRAHYHSSITGTSRPNLCPNRQPLRQLWIVARGPSLDGWDTALLAAYLCYHGDRKQGQHNNAFFTVHNCMSQKRGAIPLLRIVCVSYGKRYAT